MRSKFSHMQINVAPANIAFYKDLLSSLGWRVGHDDASAVELADDSRNSVWFIGAAKDVANDYDGPGLNHLAFDAASQAEVDAAAAFLRERNIEPLFGTPQHRPEFSGEGHTYYQVMFETPDRMLFEVVYTGPKQD
jgi:catechol 2,3-dioxygenase-like lactoylglutathione lyase family enzyme